MTVKGTSVKWSLSVLILTLLGSEAIATAIFALQGYFLMAAWGTAKLILFIIAFWKIKYYE